MNDIERYNFWNDELEKVLEEKNREIESNIRRWDSVGNKVPFRVQVEEPKKNIWTEWPTEKLYIEKETYFHHHH